MFSSTNLDLSACLRTCFLTSPDLVKAVGRQGYADSPVAPMPGESSKRIREAATVAFYRETPGIPERQRTYILQDLFRSGRSHNNLFVQAIGDLSKKFMRLNGGELQFCSDAVLQWVQHYSPRLSTLPLMAAVLAEEISLRGQDNNVIKKAFTGPIVPLPDDPTVQRVGQAKFTEIHAHYSNAAHPAFIWNEVLRQPETWIKETWDDDDQRKIWQYVLPNVERHELFAWLQAAKALRQWLVLWLLPSMDSADELADYIYKLCAVPAFALPKVSSSLIYRHHPAECLPGFGGITNTLILEGALWTMALIKIMTEPHQEAARMLHLYHLLSSTVMRLSTHQEYFKGFDLFEILSRTPLRDELEPSLHMERLVQIARTSQLGLMELRVAGKETAPEFVTKKLYRLVDAYEKAKVGKKEVGIGAHLDASMGIVCHFIKKKDSQRKRVSQIPGAILVSPRHSKLRFSLLRQMEAFLKARVFHHEGSFLVGIDGAGNEQATPPEVFAPIYQEIQYRTRLSQIGFPEELSAFQPPEAPRPICYTFHVGEEFHHLLSGLRAIDEALTFLHLPPKSRLGHCLALGFDPHWWLEESQKIIMPRMERLDDLVWFHRYVNDSDLYRKVEHEIIIHSRKIYGAPQDIPTLRQAWELRELGMLEIERHLESQKNLRKKLSDKGIELSEDSKAYKLFQAYHFDLGINNRGEERITVNHQRESLAGLAAGIRNAQSHLQSKLDNRHIAIEACPSSNLRISQLGELERHPIFKWHPPEASEQNNGLYVLLATDNPGLCQTSLPLEYCAIKQADQQRRKRSGEALTTRQTVRWLEKINEDTKSFSFITD